MQLNNGTPYQAAFTSAMDSDGRVHVVVVVKGTFQFPEKDGEDCLPAEVQDPLLTADTFWGEPGFSAPRAEMDFAHVKNRCDVLLEASAYAPVGRPTERLQAGVRVGSWSKVVDVYGDRVWLSGVGPPTISSARPFTVMPITYDRAFGGVDRSDPADDPPHANLENPVGRGWHRIENVARLNGQPLPNIEAPGDPVVQPWSNHRPTAFGPLGRGWSSRLRFAGTYDQDWIDNVFPFLPNDFDPRYYQAAPEDQQIATPSKGTQVALVNLTPGGRTAFRLPVEDMPVYFARRRAEDVRTNAQLDTVVLQPDRGLVTLTWRASLPLARDLFEISECLIGNRSAAFWRARRLGKTYYPKLRDLVDEARDRDLVE